MGYTTMKYTIKNREVAQYQFKCPYQVLAETPKNIDFEKLCAGRG